MPLPYSQDLRDRVLFAGDRGMKTKQISDLFQVSRAWVRRVKQRRRDHDETTPRPPHPKCRYRKIDRVRLVELVKASPDATLAELRDRLGIQCAESAIWKALDQLGYSFKKRRSMRRSRTDPMSPPGDPSGSRSSPLSMPDA